MPVCRQCRHEYDVGRFCTNCGHPADAPADDLDVWRTDTAERPAIAPARPRSHRASRAWLPWLAGAIALAVVAALGVWLLLADGSDPDLVADDPGAAQTEQTPAPDREPTKEPKKPDRPQPSKSPPRKPARPTDVVRLATASVPATAAPGTDFDGNVVRYEARNMLDGVPTTCWRMPGDGSGETITVELAEETRLRSVGLINGYAKTASDDSGRSLDWYAGNRRILGVEWVFDDGSVVAQELTETRRLQTIRIDPVTTSTVELRLTTVTAPGAGPSRRNYTAISDMALVGTPA